MPSPAAGGIAVVDGTVYAGWGWWLASAPANPEGGLTAFRVDGDGAGAGDPATAAAVAAGTRPRREHGPRLAVLAAIGAGGALGGVARHEIGLAYPAPPGGFPWATWAINVSGSFVLALVVTLVVERRPPTRYVRPFLAVGFCGGYTTWSTAMTDTVLLVRDHHTPTAVAYVCASVAAGLAATVAGIWLARPRPGRPRRSPT